MNACKAEYKAYDHLPSHGTTSYGFELCDYCGSLKPEDVLRLLRQPGTRYSGSDWKYGWPHKFYIEPVNPDAEKIVQVGSRDGNGTEPNDYWNCFAHHSSNCACPREVRVTGYWSRPIMGTRPTLYFKFYNKHLEELTDEQLAEFSAVSTEFFGIKFDRGLKGVIWHATRHGLQLSGMTTTEGKPGLMPSWTEAHA